MAQAADFFVSYTSADRAWAEWVAWQLEAEGYTVVVQAWDFTAGRDWAHEMQQATSTAERVVAVLSGAYLRSAHGEAEWRAFYAQDPSGERELLLPVRVDKIDPPGLLKTRIYVDLVDQDATGARQVLLAAARGARGKPTAEPEFPGDRRPAGSATEAPRFPGELPLVWNVPYHPNPYFGGRDLLLAEVHARLTAPEAERRRVVLTGLGGMGKTQLAVEYAYRQRADYDMVWWVRSQQPTSLLGDYAALAGQPPLAALRPPEDAPQEASAAAVRDWLERHRRWLLVFDNVEEPPAVAELLPRSGTGHVLLTTQAETGWEPLADPLPLGVLAPSDAADFLLSRTRQQGPEATAAATTLASSLGGLPLALEQAAAYIVAAGTVSLTVYAQLFATRALELLKRGQPLGYQHTVATAWSLALQKLQDTQPAAVRLLTLAAFMAPDDLPQPLLTAHHEELPEPLAAVAGDQLALADAVAALRRYSLVRVVADGLFVHRLLQAVVRAALDEYAERIWAGAAVRLLRVGFPYPSDAVATWPECERLLPHMFVVIDYAQRLEVDAEGWLSLLSHGGLYLWSRGQYRQALALEEQALNGYRRVLGDDHPDTLEAMNNLATTHWALGDLDSARQLHEQTVAGYRRVLGKDHPHTLTSIDNLATILADLGDLDGARQLQEQALDGYRRVLGEDHPDTLTSGNNLATTRRDLGDLDAARKLFEQVLAGRRRVLGRDDPDTLISMDNLARTRRALGDLDGARQLQEQALDACRRVLGEDHPRTLTSMNNLAEIRRDLGDLDDARTLHEQVLAGRRRVLNDDHPDTLWSMHDLAQIRGDLGDLDGARALHEQAVTGLLRVLGDDHPNTLTSMHSLAETLRNLGDLQGARELHEQALDGRRRVLGDEHPATLASMNNLAEIRRELDGL
jgi:tetratricopeptide (TPR) repeat protein